jgi:hypothetical protein
VHLLRPKSIRIETLFGENQQIIFSELFTSVLIQKIEIPPQLSQGNVSNHFWFSRKFFADIQAGDDFETSRKMMKHEVHVNTFNNSACAEQNIRRVSTAMNRYFKAFQEKNSMIVLGIM